MDHKVMIPEKKLYDECCQQSPTYNSISYSQEEELSRCDKFCKVLGVILIIIVILITIFMSMAIIEYECNCIPGFPNYIGLLIGGSVWMFYVCVLCSLALVIYIKRKCYH